VTQKQNKVLIILIGILSFHIFGFKLIDFTGSWVFNFVLRPVLSVGLSIYLLKQQKLKTSIRLRKKAYFTIMCLIAGICFIGTHLLLGTVEGFGRNPYDVSLKGISMNSLGFYPYFIVLELLRHRMVNSVRKPNRIWVVIGIVIVYTLLDYSPSALQELLNNNTQQNVEFLGSQMVPSVVTQILLTQVAIMGGWIPALVLKLSFESMFYFFAVLPDLEWITKAFVNILFPVFTLYILKDMVDKEEGNQSKRQQKNDESPVVTILTYLVSIMIVWFSVGVFPVFPTLVLTGSMEPMIKPGDIVIMQKVDPEMVQIGDVIQFKVKDYDIIHRVIAMEGIEFKTKGDNNNTADSDLVNPGFVRGKYIFHVPAIGRIPLLLKSEWSKNLRDEVEEDYELGSDDT